MSDQRSHQISRPDLDRTLWPALNAAAYSGQVFPTPEKSPNQPVAVRPEADDPAQELKTGLAEDKPARTAPDFSLKFQIDQETHEVTILLLDRASRQVVRTIPPKEMAQLKPGDLLELFA